MKALLLSFLLFFLTATGALAQRTLTGTVTDSNGEPLYGVTVSTKSGKGTAVTDLNGKYSAHDGLTVTGAGSVKSATMRNLPTLGSGFSGVIKGGSALSFTLDGTQAEDALVVSGNVVLDDDAVVSLSGEIRAGDYALVSATSISGGANASVVLPAGKAEGYRATLYIENGVLKVRITGRGLIISFH